MEVVGAGHARAKLTSHTRMPRTVRLILLSRRRELIAERPKSGNQGRLSLHPFSQIANFKRKGSRNGTCDTSLVAAPMFK